LQRWCYAQLAAEECVTADDCDPGAIHATVPAKYLKHKNLLAIRGHDTGDATYLDVTVTYNVG
jgi:hypothetical protein